MSAPWLEASVLASIYTPECTSKQIAHLSAQIALLDFVFRKHQEEMDEVVRPFATSSNPYLELVRNKGVKQVQQRLQRCLETYIRRYLGGSTTAVTTSPDQEKGKLQVPPSPTSESFTPGVLSLEGTSNLPPSESTTPRSCHKARLNFPPHVIETLKSWFESNIKHPFPSVLTKRTLAQQLGLTVEQISHWFINERMRNWPYRQKGVKRYRPVKDEVGPSLVPPVQDNAAVPALLVSVTPAWP